MWQFLSFKICIAAFAAAIFCCLDVGRAAPPATTESLDGDIGAHIASAATEPADVTLPSELDWRHLYKIGDSRTYTVDYTVKAALPAQQPDGIAWQQKFRVRGRVRLSLKELRKDETYVFECTIFVDERYLGNTKKETPKSIVTSVILEAPKSGPLRGIDLTQALKRSEDPPASDKILRGLNAICFHIPKSVVRLDDHVISWRGSIFVGDPSYSYLGVLTKNQVAHVIGEERTGDLSSAAVYSTTSAELANGVPYRGILRYSTLVKGRLGNLADVEVDLEDPNSQLIR